MNLRLPRAYIHCLFVALSLGSCHAQTQKAEARTAGFTDKPQRASDNPVPYGDTNSATWRVMKGRLDSFYRTQVAAGFNGSVLIGYQGKVLYERYFGMANKAEGMPLSAATPTQLASVSKTFTGAAVLYLYQQKHIRLDDPVTTYLPSFPYPGITVRMLLSHRTGLPDYTHWVPTYSKSKAFINNTEMLALMSRFKPALEFRPDTRFKYSNTNYAVLALIIEKVSGMPYKEYMKKYVFDPLGMKSTFVLDVTNGGLPSNAAVSYKRTWQPEPMMFADAVYGDKGIYSTVKDMYRWDQSFYQKKLLSNETMELAYGPCSFEKPGVKNYGLGWRMLCYPDGYKIIYHNGWWHGNNTCFYRFIKDNFTIIVLGNRYNNNIYHQPPIVYSIMKNVPVTKGFETDE